jgi:hypothetical protein
MTRRLLLALSLLGLTACPRPTPPEDASDASGGMDASEVGPADAGCTGDACPTALRPGPYGVGPRDLAAPFTVPTTAGPWSFEDHYTGRDHYVFLVYTPGTFRFSDGSDLSQGLFEGPVDELLQRSPRNVHYFFLWQRNEQGFGEFRDRANAAIDALAEEDRAHWRERVHFVSQQASMIPGWVGDVVRRRSVGTQPYRRYDAFQWAIDRNQRVREVGQLGTLTRGGLAADLTFLANEARYYEHEATRDARLAAQNATVIPMLDNRTVDYWEGPRNWRDAVIYADANLPDSTAMSRFDTLEVDFEMHCPNHRDGECGAWDYIADLRLCEDVPPSTDAGTGTPTDASMSADGAATDASASADAASDDASGPDAAPDATADARPAEETFRPRRAGCDREVARWITPYWREGRWVTDISQMLPLLAQGGRRTFRWYSKHQFDPREVPYVISMSLRLSNQNRGMRPVELRTLWASEGERWDSTYDARHAPARFTVPPGVRKVEVYSLITGHGAEVGQCAEFCNHTHHFAVNGRTPHSLRFPEAQSQLGCAERVGDGVVPNQHGTWYFGRGGWCPGQDVRPFVADITNDLRPGMDNEITYRTLLGSNPLAAGRSYGNIDHATYLIFYR